MPNSPDTQEFEQFERKAAPDWEAMHDKVVGAWEALDGVLKSEYGRIERLPNGRVMVTKDGIRAWLGDDARRAVEYMVLDVSEQVAKKLR